MVAKKRVAKSSDVVTLQNKEIKPQRRTADEWVELELNNPDMFFNEVNAVLDELIEVYGVERIIAEPIKVLNLIMKKEFAKQILEGTKEIEWRVFSPFYESRLIDDKVLEFKSLHLDNDDITYCVSDIRHPKVIHFHNYNNSWMLDVECRFVELIVANENSAQYFKDEYGDTTLEEFVKRNKNKDMYPLFFAIHLGKVLCSNGL